MNIKIIGLLIGFMLLTTLVTVAKPADTIKMSSSSKTRASASTMVDVPVWEIGDQWNYTINEISIDNTTETQSIFLSLSLDDLHLKVTEVTGDFYTLTFDTIMNGQGHLYTNQGSGPINISISFSMIEISGTLQIEKSTLAINKISVSLDKQKFTFNIIEQPFIPLPAFLHIISAKVTTNIDIDCGTTPITLLTFPLDTGTMWNLTATNMTINGKIESGWLYLIQLINNIAKLLNKEFLSSEVAGLLPIVDIHDALTVLGSGNVFSLPPIENAFTCFNTENITVPGGAFNVYNITLLGGIGYCYYAPTAGNMIKITGNFEGILPYLKNVNMELLSTNYS
jgi:hypothetical protein